jgi:elongation factor P
MYMAVLSYNEIVAKTIIVMDGQPYEVLSSHVFRMQQRKPVNQTKLRNLITGKVTEYSFHQNETAEEADMETEDITYLYHNRGEYWFCEEGNPKNRYKLPEETIGEGARFLKENENVEALRFEGEVISIRLPIKMDLKVTNAPPAVKGNTAQGGVKQVTLETGATINAPMFINEGDIVRINTETGEYVERVEKS